MIPDEVRQPDLPRVQWLCAASSETAQQFCSDADVNDAPEVHCARFALHLVLGVPLPSGYAWDVFLSPEYNKTRDIYRAPLAAHVRRMAFSAAGIEESRVNPIDLLGEDDPFLTDVITFRLANAPNVLGNAQLLELSYDASARVRMSIAETLRWRATPDRRGILVRLMAETSRRVRQSACQAAGHTGDPELLDAVAAEGNLFVLSFCGDQRGRPRVKKLIESENPLDWEEGIGTALILKDAELLAEARNHVDWDSRAQAILGCAWQRLIGVADADEILAKESTEHIIELLLRWPRKDSDILVRMGRILFESVEGCPNPEALTAGEPEALDRLRAWMSAQPRLSAALTRLVPPARAAQLARELMGSPDPASRVAGIEVTIRGNLTDCFSRVAELCLDAEETVAGRAADATWLGRMRCGIYGLDTAILKAGDNFSLSHRHRFCLESLIVKLLGEQGWWAENTQ